MQIVTLKLDVCNSGKLELMSSVVIPAVPFCGACREPEFYS